MNTPKRILVVDDSRTIRVQLRQLLTQAGYDVELAEDGVEGMRCARDRLPDLMVLDIQMPRTDGYTLCETLKRMGEPWDQLPVIFVTSLESHALNLLGDQMGAYLKKPVRRDALLHAVATALHAAESEQAAC